MSILLKNNSIKARNSGFSLIELMVAMFIGLFLLTGIATSYLSSKKTSVQRNESSVLEDNGRLALEFLSKSIEHTGYSPARNTPEYQFISAASPVVVDNCSDGTVNVLDSSIMRATADNASGDSIGIVYHGDSKLFTDCSGNPLPNKCRLKPLLTASPSPDGAKIYSSFYVDNTKDNLMCAGSRSSQPEIIAEGVENIQYLYGLDTVDDTEIKADRYVPASSLALDKGWNNVVSVQISVLVRSLKPVKNTSEIKKFTLLNEEVTAPDDRYKRAVFSTTVFLRNTL